MRTAIRSSIPCVALAVTLAVACGGREEQATTFPKPGETVAFVQITVAGIRSSRLVIREVDEKGPAGRAVTIRARQGTKTYPVSLPPGQYAVTGVEDPGDGKSGGSLMGGTLVFEIAPGKASYIGAFDMLIESGRFCAVDLSHAAFNKAAADLRKRHPDLAARFEIVNVVSTTDRIEADIETDGGVADR
ncbi:MAG: hypothetical protein JRF63_10430 [Deltaproteobacteria bacterium]|nr:hypothetical protein [Deltaproteobacteria bacterium]